MTDRRSAEQPASRLRLAPARVEVVHRPDGAFILRSPVALEPYARCIGAWLEQWTARDPMRLLFAERAGEGWRTTTYGEAFAAARAIGASLLARGLSTERPLVVLSDNSIDH